MPHDLTRKSYCLCVLNDPSINLGEHKPPTPHGREEASGNLQGLQSILGGQCYGNGCQGAPEIFTPQNPTHDVIHFCFSLLVKSVLGLLLSNKFKWVQSRVFKTGQKA